MIFLIDGLIGTWITDDPHLLEMPNLRWHNVGKGIQRPSLLGVLDGGFVSCELCISPRSSLRAPKTLAKKCICWRTVVVSKGSWSACNAHWVPPWTRDDGLLRRTEQKATSR